MRGLILLVTLALVPQAHALNVEAFLKDLKARKGFDRAILKLTVEEAGQMLGMTIASAGKTCEANPKKWMIRGKDSKGNTLLAVHCAKNSTDFLLAIPSNPNAKSIVSFCSDMKRAGIPCWGPLD